jgi:hypothetical protein
MIQGFCSAPAVTRAARVSLLVLTMGAMGAPAAAQAATPTPAAAPPTPATRASAPPTAQQKAAAAAAFDDGVKRFEQADYGPAAKAFLLADELLPNPDAITNAIAAARRANAHLVVAQAAERGLARAEPNSALATQAREALSQAAQHLARLELDCEPSPCSISLDGQPAKAGGRYLLPGTHSGQAKSPDGAAAEDSWTFAAGATYRITLQLPKPGQVVAPSRTETTAETPPPETPPPAGAVESTPEDKAKKKPLPKTAFFVGAGVTVVLAGITTWSGLNAMSKSDDYKDNPNRTQGEKDDVESAMTRSNVLFGATLLAAAGTAVMGVFFVDWKGNQVSAGVAPTPGGALGTVHGRF